MDDQIQQTDQEQWNEMIALLKKAYASGDKFRIQIAEGELLMFGAWVDVRGHFQPPWTEPGL